MITRVRDFIVKEIKFKPNFYVKDFIVMKSNP